MIERDSASTKVLNARFSDYIKKLEFSNPPASLEDLMSFVRSELTRVKHLPNNNEPLSGVRSPSLGSAADSGRLMGSIETKDRLSPNTTNGTAASNTSPTAQKSYAVEFFANRQRERAEARKAEGVVFHEIFRVAPPAEFEPVHGPSEHQFISHSQSEQLVAILAGAARKGGLSGIRLQFILRKRAEPGSADSKGVLSYTLPAREPSLPPAASPRDQYQTSKSRVELTSRLDQSQTFQHREGEYTVTRDLFFNESELNSSRDPGERDETIESPMTLMRALLSQENSSTTKALPTIDVDLLLYWLQGEKMPEEALSLGILETYSNVSFGSSDSWTRTKKGRLH